MAAPLDDLDRVLQSINATERQRCFLRSYVQGEGVTGIRYIGPCAGTQAYTEFGERTPGHLIAGIVGGREVQIFVGDRVRDLTPCDRVTILATQSNGRVEEYRSAFTSTGEHISSLYQDAEPGSGSNYILRRGTALRLSMTWDGRPHEVPRISPPDARHRRLDGYHACQVPISRHDSPSTRLEPFA